MALGLALTLAVSAAISQSLGPTVSLRLEPGVPGPTALDLQALTFAQARDFVSGLETGDAIDVPFPGGFGVDDLDLTVEVAFDAASRSIDFVGFGSLGSLAGATVLVTAVWSDELTTDPSILLGVRASGFALEELGLPGPIAEIDFPEVAFVLPAASGGGGLLPSSALSPNVRMLLGEALPDTGGSPDFELDLDAGLQFAGAVGIDELPDRILDVLAPAPGVEVGFRGELGLDFQLLRGQQPASLDGIALSATLPELGAVAQLDWVSTDPLSSTLLSLAHEDARWEVEIASRLLADVGGTPRRFDLSVLLDLDATRAALHLEGATTEAWEEPFGVPGIVLDEVRLEIDIDGAGEVSGAVTARAGTLPVADLGDLMLAAVQSAGLPLPQLDLPEIAAPSVEDFELRLSGGTAGLGLAAAASISLLGKPATLSFNVVRDFDRNTLLLTSVELPDFALSDLGFDGPLSGFRYPSTAFVLPRLVGPHTGPVKISARQLSSRITEILRAAYPSRPQCECNLPPGEVGAPAFVLELSPGVNLAATLPVDVVADALPGLRRLLGTAQGEEVLFEGALGLDFDIFSRSAPSLDLDRLALRLTASGLAPNLLPSWLARDPTRSTRFQLLYERPSLSATLESGVRALLDEEFRSFAVASAIDLTSGSESLTLSGSLESGWQAPFGISWLDLDTVGLTLSAGAGGAFSGALASSFRLGSKSLAVEIRIETGSGSQVGGEVLASADSLGLADLQALLARTGSPLAFPALPDIAVRDARIAFGADRDGPSFTVMGSTTVPGLNAPADVLLSLLSSESGPRIITGFQLEDFGLGQLVPALDGTLVGDFMLPSLNLVVSGGGSSGSGSASRLSAGDLSVPAREFFGSVYGTPDFDLALGSGVNLMAALPDLGPALGQALDTLGANGGAVLQGGIPTPIPGFGAGGLDINLRAALPPMSPVLPNGASPPWFRQGQVAFFIEAGAGGFAAGLDGTIGVIIDDTDLDFTIAGEFGGPPIAITLSGGMEAPEPWDQPFGIPWLTVNELGLNLSFQPVTQSLGLGFIGDGVIVTKDLALRGDLAISLSTGVPTNFVFDGESQSQFALSDLAEIQQEMRKAAFPNDAPLPLDLSKLGDVQIRPVGPDDPIRVKFALRRSPNVEPGFALAGALWAATAGGEPQELAAVDASLGLDGVFLFGQVPQPLGIGRFELTDPTIDIELVPIPPRASFFAAGDIETPWSTRSVRIDLGRDDAEAVIEQLSQVLDDGRALAADLANDAVAALRGSFRQLIASAQSVEPAWLEPLLDAIDEVEAVVEDVEPEVLLEYALAGIRVGSPEGLPSGGRSKTCPATTPFLEAGRCWTLPPSQSDVIGFQLECPAATVESGGKCYLLPVGPPRLSRDSRPEACGLFGNVPCCRPARPEPLRTLEGGRCWVTPPSRTAKLPKVSVCLGVIDGDACLATPAIPAGGADPVCPLAAPNEDGGRCYRLPPNVFLDVGNVCSALDIGCSVDELIQRDVIPAATRATDGKLDEQAPPPPPNLPPVADAGAVYEVDEGGSIWLDASASVDPEGAALAVSWDLDGDGVVETPGTTALFDARDLDGPDLLEVAFEVTDGETTARSTALLVVANAAPRPTLPRRLRAGSGAALSYDAAFDDPGPDGWDATIDYGDGTVVELLGVDPAGVPLSHRYSADGVYQLTLWVVDTDGGVGSASAPVFIPEPDAGALGLSALLGLLGLRRLSRASRPASPPRPRAR